MFIPTQNAKLTTFFKTSVATKGSLKHDISFRRRRALLKKSAKANNPFFFSLLDKKLKRFFRLRVNFVRGRRTYRIRNRSRYGRLSFNVGQRPFFKSLFSTLRSRRFSRHIKHRFFWNAAKKPIRKKLLSTYSKRWQIFFSRKYLSELHGLDSKLYSRLRSYFRNSEPSAHQLKKNTHFFNSFFSTTPCLFDYVSLLWPGAPASFIFYFISLNFCSLNGESFSDPFYPVSPNMILRLNLNSLSFFVFSLVSRRFLKGSTAFHGFRAGVKRFTPSGFFETNFNTLEFLIFPESMTFFSLKPFYLYKFNAKVMLYQRFFSKQKKFGLGRLL